MKKTPFVTLEKVQEITGKYPTPFHLYDEKGIRENAQALKEAFAWNKGFKEFFAVKATPNPFLIKILQPYSCRILIRNGLGVAFTAKNSLNPLFHANASFNACAFSRIPFSS